MTDRTLYKKIWNLISLYNSDVVTCDCITDQIIEVILTESESNYQQVHSKIWRILTDNEIHIINRHHIIDKLMDIFFQTKQPHSCTPIVPDETIEEWLKEGLLKEEPQMSEIEKTKKQIETLQQQLKILEHQESMKEPWEKAYRDVYGHFPITDSMSGSDWHFATQDAFKKCYEHKETTLGSTETDWKTAALSFGEYLFDGGISGYYTMTPCEWLKWMKEQKEMLELDKECPEETPKTGTLYSICQEWNDDEDNPPVSALVYRIEKEWIPKKTEGIISNLTIGYDNCVIEMHNKLR